MVSPHGGDDMRRFEAEVKNNFPHFSQMKYLLSIICTFWESHNIQQNKATNNDFHLKHKWQMQMLCNISEEFEGPHGHDTLEKCFLHVNYALKHFLVNTPWRCSWKLTLGIRPCFWRKCYQMQMLCKSFIMSEEFEGPHGHDTDYPILLLLLVFFYLSYIFRKCTFGHTRHESGKTNNYKYDICHIESCLHFICLFWHCAFSCGSSAALTLCKSSCIACRQKVSCGVWKHVILQTTGATGREAALLTYKWLFCSVGELVALENTSWSAWIVALVTPERLLSWMRQHVFLEVRYCCAGEFTLCAAERFFSRMKAGVFWGCQLLCSDNYTLCS